LRLQYRGADTTLWKSKLVLLHMLRWYLDFPADMKSLEVTYYVVLISASKSHKLDGVLTPEVSPVRYCPSAPKIIEIPPNYFTRAS
jgi:hypothetical protein